MRKPLKLIILSFWLACQTALAAEYTNTTSSIYNGSLPVNYQCGGAGYTGANVSVELIVVRLTRTIINVFPSVLQILDQALDPPLFPLLQLSVAMLLWVLLVLIVHSRKTEEAL